MQGKNQGEQICSFLVINKGSSNMLHYIPYETTVESTRSLTMSLKQDQMSYTGTRAFLAPSWRKQYFSSTKQGLLLSFFLLLGFLMFCTQAMLGKYSFSLYNAHTSTTQPFPHTYTTKALAIIRPTFLQRSSPQTTAPLPYQEKCMVQVFTLKALHSLRPHNIFQ